jgi:hypothetical protein
MRMRFTKDEKAAFTVGAEIEWRNGGHWHTGVVIVAISRPHGRFEECGIRHTGRTTSTVSTGAYITGTPTYVRVPA